MKREDIIKALSEAGFAFTEGGRHTKAKHPDGRVTYIGRHRSIPEGTVREIEKQTKVRLLPR